MLAVSTAGFDGPAALVLGSQADPVPGPQEVLLEVHAAAVSFSDLLMTRGTYQHRPPLPYVPGSKVAGVVSSAPAGSGLAPGQRVIAVTFTGGYAELATAGPDYVLPMPESMSFAEGAAVLSSTFTAHFALTRRARLVAGETVLVHGAGGGIGVACTQVARALGGRVIGVVSTPAKGALASAAGAGDLVPVEGFRGAVERLVGPAGVDVVVDPVGGQDRFVESLRCLAPEGRALVIGFAAGEIPTVKVNRLLLTNTQVLGVGWGELIRREPTYPREQWVELLPWIAAGALTPSVATVLPLREAGSALSRLADRTADGQVVLQVRAA